MTRTNVSKLSRLERSFVAETQDLQKSRPGSQPQWLEASTIMTWAHTGIQSLRSGGPTVDGESIGHQKGTAQDKVVFESFRKEVGGRLAPLLIRLLPRLFHHALPRILALEEQRASKSATNIVHNLLRTRRGG